MRYFKFLALAALAAGSYGCFSMQSQSTLDAITGNASSLPIVEAFIDFPGPNSRWAGPPSFSLHVVAKDAGMAKIMVVPPLFGSTVAVAKEGAGVSGEDARARLSGLLIALQGGEDSMRGCLSPIRVRLIRADGALIEKRGCRYQSTWARDASETVNSFIVAALGRN